MEHSLFNVQIPLKGEKCLVYNSLSTQLLVIGKAEYYELASDSYSPFHPRILELIYRGFLTPDPTSQYTEILSSDFIFKKDNPFIHLTIMMSESCNFSCNYCNQGQDKERAVLSADVVSAICSYITNTSCSNSEVDISWFGGEPLLHLDSLINYSNYIEGCCNNLGAIYKGRVLTNGFLLTKKNADKLYNNNIKVAQVSFDGDKLAHDSSRFVHKGTGTYDLILTNLHDVLTNLPTDFKVSLRVNVSSANASSLENLILDLENKGFNRFSNFVVYWGHIYDPTKSNIEDALDINDIVLDHRTFGEIELRMNRLLRQKGFRASHTINETKGNCIATQSNSFVIRPNGDLHKCYIPVSNKSNSCGSIFDVNTVFSSEVYKKWNSWSAFSEDNCSTCKLLGSCRGGCPINYISEAYSSETYKCPPSKLFFNEHIFDRARDKGLVSSDDWDNDHSSTSLENLKISNAA
jgi:uncharacterized protein